MMQLKIGDRVALLDELWEATVIAIDAEEITVENDDGFVIKFDAKELIKLPEEALQVSAVDLKSILREKETTKKRSYRKKPKERNAPAMEVDLHIHKLTPSTKGMTNHDMLTLQLDTAKRQLEFAIRKRIQKVVFIHGVGEGILKLELEYLFRRYDNVKFYDADYKKYGLGATEVYILQNTTD
ncbi:Smr/MutS family protein [Sungkyunkwania multivorans]|uniref:Smr/MutS family protein n=1 Tax=Sungkyunkwania multivorans TaxID=1173618 RepID=A0ABW3CUG7_9FLAO